MKVRHATILSLFCFLLCAGCGIVRTKYELPESASAFQKQRAMRIVDATAGRLGFTTDTQETMRRHKEGAPSYRRYYKGSVVIHAEITSRVAYVFLSRGGVTKTSTFREAEAALTANLREVSPDVVIITGYVPNPMM